MRQRGMHVCNRFLLAHAFSMLRSNSRVLASWVNQIDGYNAQFLLIQDPREASSWGSAIAVDVRCSRPISFTPWGETMEVP